jgi:pyrroline-5-carboxylate reductase
LKERKISMEIGFIGCGNMAKAMISGILAKGTFQKDEIIASGPTKEKMDGVSQEFGIKTTLYNIEAAKDSRILVLSVKPQMYDKVIKEIRDHVSKDQLVVTIAAGLPWSQWREALEKRQRSSAPCRIRLLWWVRA